MARKAVPHSSLISLICLLLSTPAVADYKINYIHTDHRGAPIAMTDQSATVIWRASYKPFGEAILQEDPDGDGVNTVMNIRYPGQYYDKETGTYYNYYRDYDPTLGRYIQSDPIGLAGGMNTYAYVGGNPLIYIDPYGLLKGSLTVDITGIVGSFGGSRSGGISFDDEGNVCSVYTTCQTNGDVKGKNGSLGLFAGGGFGASLSGGQLCDSSSKSTKDSLQGGVFGALQGSIGKDEDGNISASKGVVGLGFGAAGATEQCTTSVHCF